MNKEERRLLAQVQDAKLHPKYKLNSALKFLRLSGHIKGRNNAKS